MDSNVTKPKQLSFKLIIYLILSAIFCALAVLVAAMPSILSSEWGKTKLIALINERIPGKVAADMLSLHWSGPQKIEGLRLKDPEGIEILKVESAIVPESLLRLILNFAPANFHVENLDLHLITDLSGSTNLERALNKNCCAAPQSAEKQLAPIDLKNVYANVNLATADSEMFVRIEGETQQGAIKGTFKIEGAGAGIAAQDLINKERGLKELLGSPGNGIKLNVEISNFPMQVIDQIVAYKFPDFAKMPSQMAGEQLDLRLKQSENRAGSTFLFEAHSSKIDLSASIDLANDLMKIALQSNGVKVEEMILQVNDKITLQQPVSASLNLPSSLVNRFLPAPVKLKNDPLATLTVQAFSCPFPGEEGLSLDNIYGQADLVFSPLEVSASLPNLTVSGLTLHVNASPLAEPECMLKANISEQGRRSLLSQALGKQVDLNAQVLLALDAGSPQVQRLRLAVTSPLLQANFEGATVEEGLLFVFSPSVIHYQITPDFLQAAGLSTGNFELAQPQPVKLTFESIGIPLHPQAQLHLSKMNLSGNLLLKELQLIPKKSSEAISIALHDFNGKWVLDGFTNKLLLHFQGMTRLGNNQAEGKFAGLFHLEHLFAENAFNLEASTLKGYLKTDKFPVELISNLTGNAHLTPLLGPAIDISLGIEDLSLGQAPYKGTLSLNVASDHLTGEAHLLLDNSLSLVENRTAEFHLHLTPNGYAALRNMFVKTDPENFTLEGSGKALLRIQALHLPLTSPNWKKRFLAHPSQLI